MKKVMVSSLALGLAAAPAMAGSNAIINNIGGSQGQSFSDNGLYGYSWNFPEGPIGIGLPPGTLYDNIPTFLGGTSTGQITFGAFGTVQGTYLFIDWTGSTLQYTEDLQGMQPGSQITNVWYAYSNGSPTTPGVSSTHIVKIYDLLPPGPPAGVSQVVNATVGALLASVVLPAMPATGAFTVVAQLATALTIPNSGVWIKLEEVNDPTFGTFWLTGGRPGLGTTVDGLTLSQKYPYGGAYNLIVGAIAPAPTSQGMPTGPAGSFGFGGGGAGPPYTMLNGAIGLNVGIIPAPAAISLLAMGGLVSLRRRRR